MINCIFVIVLVCLLIVVPNLAIVDMPPPLVRGTRRRTDLAGNVQGEYRVSERRQSFRNEELTLECLDCICQASTGCSTTVPCREEGKPGKRTTLCGPFFISYYYWSDAGKPGSNASRDEFENFERCVSQRPCADEAVRGYMRRYAKDCDGDRVVTCLDYALIHKAGPSGCVAGQVQNSKYGQQFHQCISNPLPPIDPRKQDSLISPR